jgi:hypothetical protein
MNIKKLFINIGGGSALFLIFIYPVGRIIFTDTGNNIIIDVTSYLGLYVNAEFGDSLVDATLLISFLLAVTVVFLVNHRRKIKM